MGDELSIFLFASFAAGFLLGCIVMAIGKGSNGGCGKNDVASDPADPKSSNKLEHTSSIWLSRAGHQYHLDVDCSSLTLAGMTRRGIVEYKLCGHCSNRAARAEKKLQ